MSMPVKADVDDATREALARLAIGDVEVLEELLELREALQERSGLDPRSFALIRIAALVALDAPPASYLWRVSNAIDAGAAPREIFGVLRDSAAGRRPQGGSCRAGNHGRAGPVPARRPGLLTRRATDRGLPAGAAVSHRA